MSNDYLKPGESPTDWSLNPAWTPGSGLPKYNDPSLNETGTHFSTNSPATGSPLGGNGSSGSTYYGSGTTGITWSSFINFLTIAIGLTWCAVNYTQHYRGWLFFAIPLLTTIFVRMVLWFAFKKNDKGNRNYKVLLLLPLAAVAYFFLSGRLIGWLLMGTPLF